MSVQTRAEQTMGQNANEGLNKKHNRWVDRKRNDLCLYVCACVCLSICAGMRESNENRNPVLHLFTF